MKETSGLMCPVRREDTQQLTGDALSNSQDLGKTPIGSRIGSLTDLGWCLCSARGKALVPPSSDRQETSPKSSSNVTSLGSEGMERAAEGIPHIANASLCPFLAQIPRLVIHI